MAEPSYYDQLNKAFTEYDVVLYELVAEEGTRVPRGGGNTGTSPLGMIQLGMTDLLELEYQLAGIDYTAENLIHADMSPEEFSQSMEDRGESFFGMFLRMMGYSLARQQSSDGSEDIGLLVALFSKDRALALRRVLAGQFEDLEGSMMAIDGPNGSTLIAERNKVTLEELGKQIAAGKEKIAIFYGAGHMPDFADRIQEEFGLAPVSTRWLEAWTMEPAEE